MATQQEIEKLKKARELAGGTKQDLQNAIKERGLEDKFVNKFGTQEETSQTGNGSLQSGTITNPNPQEAQTNENTQEMSPESSPTPSQDINYTEEIKAMSGAYKEGKLTEEMIDSSGLSEEVKNQYRKTLQNEAEQQKEQEEGVVKYDNIVEDGVAIPDVTQRGDRKSLDDYDLSADIKEAFIRGNETDLTQPEIIEGVKRKLAGQGYNVTDFENRIEPLRQEFGSINMSTSDFFSSLMKGESFPKFYEKNSVDYQQAKELFDEWNGLNKTEGGMREAYKSGLLSKGLLNEVMKNEEWSQWINDEANKIVKKDAEETLKNGTVEDVLSLTNAGTAEYVTALFDKFGLNKSYEDKLTEDQTLNNNRNEYANVNGQIVTLERQKSQIYDRLKKSHPTMSERGIYALYKGEAAMIDEQLNSLYSQATIYKTNYDLRLDEVTKGINYDTKQNEQQFSFYKSLFNEQVEQYLTEDNRVYTREILEDERAYQEEQNRVAQEYELALQEITKDETLAKKFAFQNFGDGYLVRTNNQTGEYEIVNVRNETEKIETPNGTTVSPTGAIDFSTSTELISANPKVAGFKNNNPTGITWSGSFNEGGNLYNLLTEAGIEFSKGTNRPTDEGGNYVKFNSVQDGLEAYKLILTQGSYDDIKTRLKQWVGTDNAESYATDIMNQAGIVEGSKFSELSEDKLNKLLAVQIKRESSPAYIDALKNAGLMDEQGKLISSPTFTPTETTSKLDYNGVDLNYYQTIESSLPSYLKRTDEDVARLENKIKAYYNAGYTENQAILALNGFSGIQNEELGAELVSIGQQYENLGDQFFGNLGKLLREGNDVQAVNKIEKAVEKIAKEQEGTNYLSTSSVSYAQDILDKMNTLIEKNSSDVGFIKGKFSDLETKLKNNPEYQELKTLLSLSQAEQRRAYGGTAVSETEMKALQDFVNLSTDMNVENLQTALKTNFNALFSKLNTNRVEYGLPELTLDALYDKNKRTNLYIGQSTPSSLSEKYNISYSTNDTPKGNMSQEEFDGLFNN